MKTILKEVVGSNTIHGLSEELHIRRLRQLFLLFWVRKYFASVCLFYGIDEQCFFYVMEPTLLNLRYRHGKEVCRPYNVPQRLQVRYKVCRRSTDPLRYVIRSTGGLQTYLTLILTLRYVMSSTLTLDLRYVIGTLTQ